MQVVPGDDYVPEVVEEYKKILAKHDVGEDKIEYLERFDFYGHTDTAYCVVATGETARYANITLKKRRNRLRKPIAKAPQKGNKWLQQL